MADDVSFVQEIDEELRAERAWQFWQRYSSLLVTLAVLIVLASAGSVLWKNHLQALHERQTGQLTAGALKAADGKWDEAIALYAPVEAEGGALATLAALRHAAALVQLKRNDQALELYGQAAAGKFGKSPASLRDFAALEAGILAGNRKNDAQKTSDKTDSFQKASNGVYARSEKELHALNAWAAGDEKTADGLLAAIVADDTASLAARTRAAQLQDAVKGAGK